MCAFKPTAIDFVDEYLEDPKRRERVGELLKKYWDTDDLTNSNRVKSWDGNDRVIDRAEALGKNEELVYYDFYSLWSMPGHGSLAPIHGMSEKFVRGTSAQALATAFHLFGEITHYLIRELGLEQVEAPNLRLIMERFREAAGDT